MRTLNANLTAAQKSASRHPIVKVTIENKNGAARRHDFQTADSASAAGNKHDVAVTSNNVMHRVRSSGGEILYQRSLNFAAWTQLATGRGSSVAISAEGTNVIVIYNGASPGTAIYFRESTDGGANFGAETLITTAAASVIDLAAAYKDAGGDVGVSWVQTTQHFFIQRVSGAWGATQTNPASFNTLNGVAMHRFLHYEMILTGNEITTVKPTIWSTQWDLGGAAFSTPQKQIQGDSGVTSFGAPFLTHDGEHFRITFIEAQLFASGYTRTFRTWQHGLRSWNVGPAIWRTPTPVNYSALTGIAIASGPPSTASMWESSLDFARAASQAATTHDATARVLALALEETHTRYDGFLDLDNTDGFYKTLPAALKIGNLAKIELGYKTPAGDFTSPLNDLYIAAYEFRRAGGASTLRLFLESAWDQLRRNVQRTAIVETGDTLTEIIDRILARAGLSLINANQSARATGPTPTFTIDPATSGYAALQAALDQLADRMFAYGPNAAMRMYEPLTSDTADYTFGGDHPVNTIEIRSELDPIIEAHAFGAGAIGDDLDFAQAEHAIGHIGRIRDITSTTGAAADATAVAHRRQHQLRRDEGRFTAPPNVGLELMDVVQLSDDYIAASDTPRRVTGIRWRYDARRGIFDQEVRLGPR